MSKKTLTPIFLTIIFGLTVSYIAYAWSEPTKSMPSDEVYPPINTGSDTQTKTGTLKIDNGGGSVFQIESGGDIEIFTSDNRESVSLFCDTDEQLTTNGTIDARGGLCINGDCKSSWEEVGSGSASGGGDSPIGTIIAWAKSLSGTPSIPTGWVECNGQVLSDSASPYNGQTMPNLNSGTFLRGNTTSGGTGGSSTTTTSLETVSRSSTRLEARSAGYVWNSTSQGTYTAGIKQNTNSFSILPPYYNVVWIIKVKNTSGGSSGSSLWQENGTDIYYNSGNVGIGTTSPSSLLDVNGNLRVSGKLTVGTIDPEYEINGETYATYGIDFAGGVRNETAGVINIKKEYIIDFNGLEEGSDMWLFWETSNKNIEETAVILTPGFNGKAWYEKDLENNTITIYSEKSGEISYRLTIPRHDDDNWPNKVK